MTDPATPTVKLELPQMIQALQYLFDVARQASVPASVHDQTRVYAQQLSTALNDGGIAERELALARLDTAAKEMPAPAAS